MKKLALNIYFNLGGSARLSHRSKKQKQGTTHKNKSHKGVLKPHKANLIPGYRTIS
jgi:hypothetical protein